MNREELANNLEARARWAYQQTRASFALEGHESYDVWGEIDRLRAELTGAIGACHDATEQFLIELERAEKAEARLAAVIALCDYLDNEPCQCCGQAECSPECRMDSNDGYASSAEIRAAATGETTC